MDNIKVKTLFLNDIGEGVFKINNKYASCKYILPGEEALVSYNNKQYKLIKVLKEASNRVKPKCSIYDKCGSCQLLHMDYKSQIDFKYNYVLNCFKEENINYRIDEVIESKIKDGYRNKLQVAFKKENNEIKCGFYEEESHKIINLNNCLVHTKKQNDIVNVIKDLIKELKIEIYNEDKRTGLLRFVTIREAFKTNEVLVTIVTNSDIFPSRNVFCKKLIERCPYITSIIQNVNTRKTSIILGDKERVLYGKPYITDILLGLKFNISSKTFYQVNSYQTEKLYDKVREYCNFKGNEVVLDSYCGIGTIGMSISKYCKYVVGVESNKNSIFNAINNCKINNIANCKFICDDATNFIKNDKNNYDCIIMDPPRSGSTIEFLNAIKKKRPKKIIYVSCEAKTLARDLKYLLDKYDIKKTCIVDMFVGTYHVESVNHLILKHI